MCLEAHCISEFIFSLTGILGHHFQRMINNLSNKININHVRLVSMCFLGNALWLILVQQVTYVHSMGLQLKSTRSGRGLIHV